MFRALSIELNQQVLAPNIHGYVPMPKQELFHKSTCRKKLFIGGNRSGKTLAGVTEDIWWITKKHPNRELPPGPIRGRVVGVDFLQGVQKILLPMYSQMIPPSELIDGSWERSYDKQLRTLTLENDSFLEFMSYDQDTDKFAGTSRHFNHYDEEPPEHIFNESNARLVDTNGSYWITMTPIEGLTWVYDKIYLPGSAVENKSIFVIEVDMKENIHLEQDAMEDYLGGLDKDERLAREHGKFIQIGGLVFKKFSDEVHVIDSFTRPRVCQFYSSIDDGWNNPTCILWHAVDQLGNVTTFGEHYAKEMTIKEHAQTMKIMEKNWRLPVGDIIRAGDPAMKQTSSQTGVSKVQTYAENGIYLQLEGMPTGPGSVDIGLDRMQQYLRYTETSPPKWHITANCTNLIREMKRLHWATFAARKSQYTNNPQEKIHKKDDHAPDSARYFFTFLPDLKPDSPVESKPLVRPHTNNESYDQVLVRMYDTETTWKVHEGSDLYALEYEG